jgi:hypothetical protein
VPLGRPIKDRVDEIWHCDDAYSGAVGNDQGTNLLAASRPTRTFTCMWTAWPDTSRHPDFVARVDEALALSRLQPDLLVLKLMESVVVDTSDVDLRLAPLRANVKVHVGVRLAPGSCFSPLRSRMRSTRSRCIAVTARVRTRRMRVTRIYRNGGGKGMVKVTRLTP